MKADLQQRYAFELCQLQFQYTMAMKEQLCSTDMTLEDIVEHVGFVYEKMTVLSAYSGLLQKDDTTYVTRMLGLHTRSLFFSQSFREELPYGLVERVLPVVTEPTVMYTHSPECEERSRVEFACREGLTPLTPEVFGMMHTALALKAYDDMRAEDIEDYDVLQRYTLDEDILYRFASQYGYSSDLVDYYSNQVVKNVVEMHEPLRVCFTELAYDKDMFEPKSTFFVTPRQYQSIHQFQARFGNVLGKLCSNANSVSELRTSLQSSDMTKLCQVYCQMLKDDQDFSDGTCLIGTFYPTVEDERKVLADCTYSYTLVSTYAELLRRGDSPIPERDRSEHHAIRMATQAWFDAASKPTPKVCQDTLINAYQDMLEVSEFLQAEQKEELELLLQKQNRQVKLYNEIFDLLVQYFDKCDWSSIPDTDDVPSEEMCRNMRAAYEMHEKQLAYEKQLRQQKEQVEQELKEQAEQKKQEHEERQKLDATKRKLAEKKRLEEEEAEYQSDFGL